MKAEFKKKKKESIAQCLQNHTEGWLLHKALPEEKDKAKQQRSVRRLRTTRDIKSNKPTKHLVCEVIWASMVSLGPFPHLFTAHSPPQENRGGAMGE